MHRLRTPSFQTHLPDPAESAPDVRAIWQFKVKEINPAGSSDPSLMRCRLCRSDGSDEGDRDFIVAAAVGIFHAVGDVIQAARPRGGTAFSFNSGVVSWMEFGAPVLGWCKISYDFSDGDLYTNAGCVYATPCTKAGTLLGAGVQFLFLLTGHQVQLQGYCNLAAGDIVAYHPLRVVPAPGGGNLIGLIAHMPIVATSKLYACLQTSVVPGSGTGGRVVFDYVRSH